MKIYKENQIDELVRIKNDIIEGQRENSYKIQHCGVIFAERMKPCCAYAKNQSSDLEIFHPSLNKIKPVVAAT